MYAIRSYYDKLRTEGFPHPANEESATGAAILARDVIHYPDVLGDPNVPVITSYSIHYTKLYESSQ